MLDKVSGPEISADVDAMLRECLDRFGYVPTLAALVRESAKREAARNHPTVKDFAPSDLKALYPAKVIEVEAYEIGAAQINAPRIAYEIPSSIADRVSGPLTGWADPLYQCYAPDVQIPMAGDAVLISFVEGLSYGRAIWHLGLPVSVSSALTKDMIEQAIEDFQQVPPPAGGDRYSEAMLRREAKRFSDRALKDYTDDIASMTIAVNGVPHPALAGSGSDANYATAKAQLDQFENNFYEWAMGRETSAIAKQVDAEIMAHYEGDASRVTAQEVADSISKVPGVAAVVTPDGGEVRVSSSKEEARTEIEIMARAVCEDIDSSEVGREWDAAKKGGA